MHKKNLPDIKWFSLLLYALIAFIIWNSRDTLYRRLPHFFFETRWFVWFLNALLLALIAALFICLVELLRCPPFEKYRFKIFFKQVGLHNDIGQYPSLLSKKADRQKSNSYIYKLNNIGIPIEILDSKFSQNGNSLGIKEYKAEYGRRGKTILIYAIPLKYVTPTIISLDNHKFANELCRLPNLLCIGQTGSGKSYSLSIILAIYARYIPNISITIADYKHSLLTPLADTPNYFGYTDAILGITQFYEEFRERLANHDPERNKQVKILLIDEYSALINAQEKKAAENLRNMVGNLLLMSRGLGMICIIGMQTAHAEHFKAGARDQFHAVLALGNLSKEQKQMLFYDYRDKMNDHNRVGEGYLLIDGKDLERVKIAEIKDMDSLCDIIRPAMNR